jgi:hypothetical protein
MLNSIRCLSVGIVLLTGTLTTVAQEEEFRIETDVFMGDADEPFAENVTIFSAGLVYDFPLAGPEQITVFDPIRGRFVLLDVTRRIKTTLTIKELLEFTAAMKVHAGEKGGVFAAACDPQFAEEFDAETGWLSFDSKLLSYRTKGAKPKISSAARDYQEFADWYARLNATRPGSLPPFARIQVNRALNQRGEIPIEVELTVSPPNRLLGRKLVIRSRHLPYWRLSNTDRKRIDTAGSYMAKFEAVSFKDYRRATEEKADGG